jgi:hypothetical protein
MTRSYEAPCLVHYGTVQDITALFGSANVQDVLVDLNGNPTSLVGTGSINACPTSNMSSCQIR